MTTQKNDVVVIDADGLARVCAWCVPAKRLAEIHRQVRCSDGLCPDCRATLEDEQDERPDVASGRSPLRLLLGLVVLLVTVSACSGGPTAPAAAPIVSQASAPRAIAYAINIPDYPTVIALQRQFPTGVALPPVQAQLQWDYTAAYGGSPNVYFGETGPHCQYPGVGIVVAPLSVASADRFTAADWPGVLDPGVTYTWVGQFVYTLVATPGTYSYDPTGRSCSTPKK